MDFEKLIDLLCLPNAPQIRTDSRLVKKGDIFIALKGTLCDGHDFIDQALENGAAYILCEHPPNLATSPAAPDRVPKRKKMRLGTHIVIVEDSSVAAATLAQAHRGKPSGKLTNLAVTGTNGKTTVAFLLSSIIRSAGKKCGLIGTVFYDTGQTLSEANLTTPDCLTIAHQQAQMVKAGAQYMVIEASSHAIDQNRLAEISFKAAAFTNLSGDHLDYHKTKQNYLDAKAKLFENLSPDATAVLNAQSPEAMQIAKRTKARILFFAIDAPANLTAHIESMDITGTTFTIRYESREQKIKTPLLGEYNVENHLAAAGLALAAGLDLKTIAAGLSALKVIPGRLEKIDSTAPFTVIIDYAHTDDALTNVLSTLKPLSPKKLIVVFGCGGDRDRTKRPRMAKAAEKFASSIIVTNDNPRTENPDCIIADIVAGFSNPASTNIRVEPNRERAIRLAIENARENDTVLIAGKGHETHQIIGNRKFHFSDKETALDCLHTIT